MMKGIRILRQGSLAAWLAVGATLLLSASAAAATVTGDAAGNVVVVSAPGESNLFTFQHEKNIHTSAMTEPFTTTFPSAWEVNSSVLPPGGGGGPPAPVPASPPCKNLGPSPTTPVVCPDGGSMTFELGDGIDQLGGGGIHAENILPSHVIADGGSGDDILSNAAATGGTWELDGGPDADSLGVFALNVLSEGANVKEALPGTYILKGGEGDDRFLTSGFSTFPGAPPISIGSDAIAIQVDGGPGNDQIHLIETKGDDHLAGGEGDDTFEDGEGDDTVEGGPGNDNVWRGPARTRSAADPAMTSWSPRRSGSNRRPSRTAPKRTSSNAAPAPTRVYADETDTVAADCDELGDVIQSAPKPAAAR